MAWADLSDLERGWLVGLLEGEGCFTVASDNRRTAHAASYRRAQILLSMTDKDVVLGAQALMGGTLTMLPVRRKMTKPGYQLSLRGSAAVEWMRAMRPHMGLRRKERIDALLKEFG